MSDRIESIDATDLATAAGWTIPHGWAVVAYVERNPCMYNPYTECGSSDVDEPEPDTVTRAFCRHCDGWIRKLDEDSIAGVGPDADGRQPVIGDWTESATGIDCPGADDRVHQPAEPVAVRWWQSARWIDVLVGVEIMDADGRSWGIAVTADGLVYGEYPQVVNRNTGEISVQRRRPLTDSDSPVPLLIDTAARKAQQALFDHANAAPVILYTPPQPGAGG